MRVIAGKARSLPLKTIEGNDTRPTTDRIKETLFNMIHDDLPGSYFLDLFSGSGAIGIEALSRGADKAVFVENAKKACTCIQDNLNFTHLAQQAVVMETDALTAIRRLCGKGVFDIVFMDPPYQKGLEAEVLSQLKTSDIIDEYTQIIVEASLMTDLSFVEDLGYDIVKVKKYKTNQHIFCKIKRN